MRYGWFTRPKDRFTHPPRSALRNALRTTQIAIRSQLSGGTEYRTSRPHVIVVTSALAQEGKTVFCVSMARMLAADGVRVMLIDADLRCPRVGPALGAARGGDLVDLLEGNKPLEDVIRVDSKSGLHFVVGRSGIENPQSILSGMAFQQFLQGCALRYNIVIIDTPPVLEAIDAAVVAPMADACIYLVRWGRTPLDTVLAGLRLLHLCKVSISGIVLSRVRLSRHPGYSGYPPSGGDEIYPLPYQAASQIKR
jgi:succinoglycan biosynthesis transport protein ExoP